MILRPYQQRVIDQTYDWWMENAGEESIPLMVLPTAAGKSVIIADLVRLLFEHFPDEHPRTVVLVPSKELAEQNAEKLRTLLPDSLTVGYYSASLGKRDHGADVIVATIGSIYRHAARLGNIKVVLIDEAHLVNPDGAEAGRYRRFLSELAALCDYRAAGCTATPFRGNGVWLTDGDAPLFTGVCATVTIGELIDGGFLSPMVRPVDEVSTRIDTSDIATTSGDYKLDELGQRVEHYLPSAAAETLKLAADRKKWIAFLPTVHAAEEFISHLSRLGVEVALVCGETPKTERDERIAAFRRGEIRCLVTVLALATGFDVPDVDCVVWLRPTQSPVLYMQGAGRGMRIAPGKTDCLWIDFSDTTERMGPIDAIRGRRKRMAQGKEAPFTVCPNCGNRVPAALMFCPVCGERVREEEPDEPRRAVASAAPILSKQIEPKINVYPVNHVRYVIHIKGGKPPSMRVDYSSGMVQVASEWVCFEHEGFARQKAINWWRQRSSLPVPVTAAGAVSVAGALPVPRYIKVDETRKYPEILGMYATDPRETAT